MLGKIYEQKGWEGKAIEHYEIFLDSGKKPTLVFQRLRMRSVTFLLNPLWIVAIAKSSFFNKSSGKSSFPS